MDPSSNDVFNPFFPSLLVWDVECPSLVCSQAAPAPTSAPFCLPGCLWDSVPDVQEPSMGRSRCWWVLLLGMYHGCAP